MKKKVCQVELWLLLFKEMCCVLSTSQEGVRWQNHSYRSVSVEPWREQSTLTHLSIQLLNLWVPELVWQLILPLRPEYNNRIMNKCNEMYFRQSSKLICQWISDVWIFNFVSVSTYVLSLYTVCEPKRWVHWCWCNHLYINTFLFNYLMLLTIMYFLTPSPS